MAQEAATHTKTEQQLQQRPPQQQSMPGRESDMTPRPLVDDPDYKAAGKLLNKVAVITGGDSGIGRAVAVIYAKEGADVVIVYHSSHEDATETKRMVEGKGRRCLTLPGDIRSEAFCREVIEKSIETFGKLDILVNNAAIQYEVEDITQLDMEQMELTFRTNIFAMFYLAKAAVPHLKEGSAIINTTSVTAYKGSPHLLDYSTTKGAIEAFTYSLSGQLAEKGIRVNAVAPGPIWTPLIVASFQAKDVQEFGSNVPLGRAGQPSEVAPCYVFLAAKDSSYMTGQILHPNGGTVVHG